MVHTFIHPLSLPVPWLLDKVMGHFIYQTKGLVGGLHIRNRGGSKEVTYCTDSYFIHIVLIHTWMTFPSSTSIIKQYDRSIVKVDEIAMQIVTSSDRFSQSVKACLGFFAEFH